MPSQKLTARTLFAGTIAGTDLFHLVSNPGSSPQSWKATMSQLATYMATALSSTFIGTGNLIQGTGMSLGVAGSNVTISVGSTVVLNNLVTSAGGTSLLKTTVTNGVTLKGLAAGSGISITSGTDTNTIAINFTPITGVASSAGSGRDIQDGTSGNDIVIKKLTSTDNFNIGDDGNVLSVDWNGATSTSSLSGITFTKSDTIEAAVLNDPQTGNITIDPTSAKLGAIVTIVNHSDGTEPTITASTGSIRVYKAGTYTPGARNRISIQYVGINTSSESEFEASINTMV